MKTLIISANFPFPPETKQNILPETTLKTASKDVPKLYPGVCVGHKNKFDKNYIFLRILIFCMKTIMRLTRTAILITHFGGSKNAHRRERLIHHPKGHPCQNKNVNELKGISLVFLEAVVMPVETTKIN